MAFSNRREWCATVLMALCVCCGTVRSQAPTFDATPCAEDVYTQPRPEMETVDNVFAAIPTATDSRGDPAAVVCDAPLPGPGTYRMGSTRVNCTAVDTRNRDLQTECFFTVYVLPEFTRRCPSDIVQENPVVSFQAPFAIGSGGDAAIIQCSMSSDETFDPGLTTVGCTARDTAKNLNASCTFRVTIGTAPTFDDSQPCDEDFNVAPTAGQNMAINVEYPARSATDNTADPVTPSCDPRSGDDFEARDTPVTCTARDSDTPTLIKTCDFRVRVYPTFTVGCPDDIIQADGAAVDFPMPVAVDSNGTFPNVTCDPMSGEPFVDGATTVECSAEDSVFTEQNVSCSFTVTIGTIEFTDLGSCGTRIDVAPDPDSTSDSASGISWVKPTAVDGRNVSCNPDPNTTTFDGGVTEVTCTVQNDTVPTLKDSCNFTVAVYPTFVEACPGPDPDNILYRPADPGDYRATVTWLNPVAVDKDGGDLAVTCTPPSGSLMAGDETDVTCEAEEASDTNLTCSFKVVVVPTMDELTVVKDKDQGPDPLENTATVYWTLPTVSKTFGDGTLPVTCTRSVGSKFDPGVTEVACTAEETFQPDFTIRATNKFQVRVFPYFDTGCPADKVEDPDGTSPTTEVRFDEPAATQLDSSSEAVVTCDPESGSEFPNDNATVVTCTAMDATTGNNATCAFLVTVGQAPMFDDDPCHDPVDVAPDPYDNRATNVSWVDPIATDRFNNEAEVTCDPESGTDFDGGMNPVRCSAVDGILDSLIRVCEFSVRVSPTFDVGCPDDIFVVPNENGEAEVSWPQLTGNDDITGEPAAVECDRENGSVFNETETTVICTATDAETKFTASCMFTVTFDTQPPTPVCPTGNNVTAAPGTDAASYSWTLTATDDHTNDSDIFLSCIPPSDSLFKYGETKVVCTAVDSAGNVGECSFDVRVTGASCTPQCSETQVCNLLENGDSLCVCDTGYAGDPCENMNECAPQYPSSCNPNANCTDLDPPEFFSCECNEGFYGDGVYSCDPLNGYVQPEYPDIPVIGSVTLEKTFATVLAVADASVYGCDPDTSKTSDQCLSLVKAFKEFITPLYRRVSPDSFKEVVIDQTAITKGSVVIPHTAAYDYATATEELRGMEDLEFYERSVLDTMNSADRLLGSLALVDLVLCTDCHSPQDSTDVCTAANKTAVACTGKRVLVEDKRSTTDSCVLKCVSPCEANEDYCNGGKCSQEEDKDPVCSECPPNTEGPTCGRVPTKPVPTEGPNIPLIVGLSVGLGGGALLIILGIVIYFVCVKNKESKVTGSTEEDGEHHEEALRMESRDDKSK